jgi:benzil reductase ((S)-benzoin forming)
MTEKPWLVGTGFSRGIGAAIVEVGKPHFQFLSLCRKPSGNADIEIPWDLSKPFFENKTTELFKYLNEKKVVGFLHCAGIVGPTGGSPEDLDGQKKYWEEFSHTMDVNATRGLEIISALSKFLKPRSEHPPFVLHLSSGAALNPYVGLDAYCTSKAAALMAFRILAEKFPANKLLALSILPGTVHTDMMRKMLSCNESDVPKISKFHKLQKTGMLSTPQESAQKIIDLLLSSREKLVTLHGKAYDVRNGSLG